jgi:ATP-dependent DNA ligase
MLKFESCEPVLAKTVPTGPDWIHEVKYDGYRGCIVRDGKAVKLLSKSGLDWTWRFPFIVDGTGPGPATGSRGDLRRTSIPDGR